MVRYLKKVYFKNDKRVAAFVVCVGIATGFWFLNALSKTYTVDITVPVRYINLPNNKTLSNQLPNQFDLTIKARGFTILRSQIGFLFMPLEFNVNNMTDNRMMDRRKSSFSFPVRQFLTELSNQLSSELEIMSMTPDTLFFQFGHMRQKKVKVKTMVQVNLKKQFYVSGDIITNPDSVVVNGPQAILDTLHFVLTEAQRFIAIDKSIQTEVRLQKIKDSYFEPQNVIIHIPIEEYTEAELSVPIHLANRPSGINIKFFPPKVKVTFLVGLSRFRDIRPEDFKLNVNYSEIKEGKPRLKITCETNPPYLYDFKIAPEEIEYLIENQEND